MDGLRHEILRNGASFRTISDDWTDICFSVFQSHSWLSAWLDHAPRHRLNVALAWHYGKLVAALPFAVRNVQGLRILEWMAQDFSDYCDGLGDETLLLPLWREVVQTGGFDVVRLKNIPPDAKSMRALGRTWEGAGWNVDPDHDICLRVASHQQWSDGEQWYRTLNKKKRSNHSRGWRILGEIAGGPAEFRECTSELTWVLPQLRRFKRDWLVATEQQSPLLDSGDTMFDALVQALADSGCLHVFAVMHGDDVIAGSLNIEQGSEMMAFFAAYDPRFARASPGILLMTEYTKWAFDRGFKVVDYLRGDEVYKFEFASEKVSLATVAKSQTLLGRGAMFGYGAFRTAKRLMQRRPQLESKSLPAIGSAYETKAGTLRMPKARDTVG